MIKKLRKRLISENEVPENTLEVIAAKRINWPEGKFFAKPKRAKEYMVYLTCDVVPESLSMIEEGNRR